MVVPSWDSNCPVSNLWMPERSVGTDRDRLSSDSDGPEDVGWMQNQVPG